jgi:hypothetical protein
MIAWYMHLRAIPNRNSLVIFKSTGKFTKILPSAVIRGLKLVYFFSSYPSLPRTGGGIVNAPVYCKFLTAFMMSRSTGG